MGVAGLPAVGVAGLPAVGVAGLSAVGVAGLPTVGVATTPPVATAATATPLFVAAVIDQPILAVVYAITVGISVWLFRDARRRGRSVVAAIGWAVGGVVLPGIVHFGYLYGRGGVGELPERSPDE